MKPIVDDIAAFIADDNPGRAVTFIQDIRAKFRVIQRTPLLYQRCPDIGEDLLRCAYSASGLTLLAPTWR